MHLLNEDVHGMAGHIALDSSYVISETHCDSENKTKNLL
jgi:hypothetical protein